MSHFSPAFFVFSLSLHFSLSFRSRKNPDASDGTIDRKKICTFDALLTVEMIISAPIKHLWHHSRVNFTFTCSVNVSFKTNLSKKEKKRNVESFDNYNCNESLLMNSISLVLNKKSRLSIRNDAINEKYENKDIWNN